MQTSLKQRARSVLHPLAAGLRALGARPNHVTLAGLVASLLAGIGLARGHLFIGLLWLIVGLLCDMLDGDLARLERSQPTRFGAFFDSCADRISEALVLGGLLIGKDTHGGGLDWAWMTAWVLALSGSFMVSYARARAEGLDIPCAVGIAERPERMVLLILMIVLGFKASLFFLIALAALSWITFLQRAVHVVRSAAALSPPPTIDGGGRTP